jgi:hypothetical protein
MSARRDQTRPAKVVRAMRIEGYPKDGSRKAIRYLGLEHGKVVDVAQPILDGGDGVGTQPQTLHALDEFLVRVPALQHLVHGGEALDVVGDSQLPKALLQVPAVSENTHEHMQQQ